MKRALALALFACSPSTPRDVVPETHDVRGADAAPPDDYVYVARREHGVIGVVATRELTLDDTRRIADSIADGLEACARSLEPTGKLAVGAAKLTAGAGPNGAGAVGEMRLAPGNDVAANALLCLVAPIRTTPFPKTGSLLLEVTWNPIRLGNSVPSTTDGGGSM